MVQNNKILTVSYGAFSCTLEGFDDSLDTMKAVAGYFRDLASDDRHFGAEPLQADAEPSVRITDRDGPRDAASDMILHAGDAVSPSGSRSAMRPTTTSAPQNMADKLQRIRAVVSQSEGPADNYCEDEPADIFVSAAAEDIRHALRHEDDVFYDTAEDTADDELARALDRMDGSNQTTQRAEETPADAPDIETIASARIDSTGLDWPTTDPTLLMLDTATVEYTDAGMLSEAFATVPKRDAPWIVDMNDSRVPEDCDDQDDQVVTMESGALRETAEPNHPANPAFPKVEAAETTERDIPAQDSVSPDNVAGPLSETVADETYGEERIDNDDSGTVEDAKHGGEGALDGLSESDVSQDEDLARLMASVETQMNNARTASNRETYDHMRAAVAAADNDLTEKGDVTAYRDDVANTVRPRRPVAKGTGSRTPRPAGESRPAPLRLVAEQRVDLPHMGAAGPVHPRRVALASARDSPAADDGRFAQFAADMGAASLPELLEAAAAYLSFVEKRAQFSRPQLINTVRQLDDQSFNREDGLHSFGELLREGKIAKTGGGCFTASEYIGFRPDKYAAG